ncbi:hypothetical protein Pan216_16800 [Planctomycetes bacterium Pan216]|uniref:Sulfatase n=1 Tax=Kolteria novifilia TaxID=2527975 RepID=A0A518B1H8_9BACT|nr:hypothetical protein Pan216_16800 [Planctomycetes bacterium Pan216]
MKRCHRDFGTRWSRREVLRSAASGFGAVALAALLGEESDAASTGPLVKAPHYAPKVRNIIFLYMDGGPSQVDTFDPKPLLTKEHGKPFASKIEPTQFNNIGTTMASPWKFNRYGESGIPVSDLFPLVAQSVDDLAVIRSMVAPFSEHTSANYFLHSGLGVQGRPSMGAWVGYGLGSESKNLPGFIVLNGGLIPPGGLENFGSGFLPAAYQGSLFRPSNPPVANIQRREKNVARQNAKLDLMRKLDGGVLERYGQVDALESAIQNHEMAARMQTAVPDLMEFSGESDATKSLYGLDAELPTTRTFAMQCLIARRLVERGVRFIELTCPAVRADRWDQHSKLKEGHDLNARTVDQPIAGLLKDLKARGLFDQTLVVWGGEFGRTPFAQGSNGRDHNPFGFSIWLAGGGIKGGTIYGQTDEFGYKAIENRVEIHDLHATMLHLLGINHEKLTFRFGGRDMRLTDVHGHIIKDILV